MIAVHMHFFCDLYAKQRASWFINESETFWWHRCIKMKHRKKSAHCGNEFMKQVLVMMSKNIHLIGL